MANPNRDEFTQEQKDAILEANALEVVSRWRDVFSGKVPHYICEECLFVSEFRDDFEIDHVQPCNRGGTAIAINSAVLCVGCNQAKKVRQFVPPGAGYAYRRHQLDQNPDHVYGGAPKVTAQEIAEHPEPYDVKRYPPG